MNDFDQEISKLSPAQLELLAQRLVTRAKSQATKHTISRRSDPGAAAPLSFAQQRLWFIDQLEPGTSTYNLPIAIQVSGRLDLTVLERTLSEVVRRHETLRTRFVIRSGQPVQIVDPPQPLSAKITDLSHLPKSECMAEARRLSLEEAERPFNLATGPLIRAELLRLADEEHIMLFTMHHVISDGWSMGVLVHEVELLYAAFSQDRSSPLKELTVQYSDFAVWQRGLLQDEALQRQLSYWRPQLSDLPPLLKLPTDHPRPPVQTFNGRTQRFFLPDGLADDLRRLSRDEGVTLFMLLLAAFKTLLMRYTGQTDVWVGTPVANRPRVEMEPLVGFFVNTLVLRTDLGGDPTFIELLGRISSTCVEAFAHQDLSFERLVEALQPDRDASHPPLFQVMFALQDATGRRLPVLPDLELRELKRPRRTSTFELTFMVIEERDRLGVSVEYNTDLFETETIRRMARRWARLLREVSQRPGARLSELEWLSKSERKKLLISYSGAGVAQASPAATLARTAFVHELVSEQARLAPGAPAVAGDSLVTYGLLESQARRVAQYLTRLGVGPEARVTVLCTRAEELAASVLGIFKSGGAYVPLDAAHSTSQRVWMLEDCGAGVLLVGSGIEAPKNCRARVVRLNSVWAEDESDLSDDALPSLTPESLACVIYTSGSTGNPKGICVTHGALANYISDTAQHLAIGPHDRLLQFASHNSAAGLEELFVCLSSGAALVPRITEMLSSPRYFIKECTRLGITILHLPTAYWDELISATTPEDWRACEALRLVCIRSEYALPEPAASWWRLTDGRVRLVTSYVPAGMTMVATMQELRPGDEGYARPTIGQPIRGTTAFVLDGDLQPVPEGVAGDLYIGGAGVVRGYLNRPDLTAERFIPCPHGGEPGARLYRTGDLVSWREGGVLDYLGHSDEQVKVRGYRVEVGEVEAVLRGHLGVREAVVVARRMVGRKGSAMQLVAYMVPHEAVGAAAAKVVRDYLKKRLPDYMIPSVFIMVDHLPRTASGKIDRQALALRDTASTDGDDDLRSPTTPVEEVVASVWAEVLRVRHVRADDNFFDLGGHSLLATQAMLRLNEALGVELPLRTLFENPTVAGISREVEVVMLNGRPAGPPIRRVEARDELPLSFAQQRLWFLDQLQPHSGFYNIPSAVKLQGRFDSEALQRSLNEIVRRHEALRTIFPNREGEPVQVIRAAERVMIEHLDLSNLPAFEREAQTQELAATEAQVPFDLSRGPLLRVKLLRLGTEEHVLLLTMHHIISDGWSIGVLIRELTVLYEAYSGSAESPLEELPIQYADYAVWQRDWLQGEVLEAQLNYWREQLADAPAALELPADRARPAVQSYRGAAQSMLLPLELSHRLKELSQQHGVTLFMTLLAAFDVLLYRYSGQEDFCVGSPIANRNRAEIENLIGFFANTLVLRTDLSGDPSFKEVLGRVREVTLGAYAHQDMPLERLVEELQPERALSHSPLFQVMFVLQNTAMRLLPLRNLTLSAVEATSKTAKFDLIMSAFATEQGLELSIEYSSDLFAAETIAQMLEHYERLLAQVVLNVDERVSRIQLLSQSEREQMVTTWNETARPYASASSIQAEFEAQAARRPWAVAVSYQDRRLSYEELNERANQVAHWLRQAGVRAESRVGICVERTELMVIGVLGILKAGGAYVPLDAQYPASRLEFMVADAAVSVLLTEASLVGVMAPLAEGLSLLQLDADRELLASQAVSNPVSEAGAENLAYMIYTSGSSGIPKGVGVTHRAVLRLVLNTNYVKLDEESLVLQGAPLSFDASTFELWGPLLHGGRIVLLPEAVPTAAQVRDLIASEGLTTMWLTASLFNYLVDEEVQALCGVRQLLVGGEALSVKHVGQALAELSGTELINGYGPTEATTFSCTYGIRRVGEGGSIPIGQPVANTRVYVLERSGELAPVGVAGELYIGGEGLARGYWRRPELTAERFVPDGMSGRVGERLYRTGDLVKWNRMGELEYIGRLDQQVKVRGYRIELGEIEQALLQHERVREAVVVVDADDGGGQRLVSYVVAETGAERDSSELRRYLQERLPGYMVPGAFVYLEQLPLTANGKVDRRALPSVAEWTSGEGGYEAPRTVTEEIVAGIWSQVLQLDRVGVGENFFEIGGHSLLATQVMSRVRKSFGVELALRELFEQATVASLAQRVEEARRNGRCVAAPPIVVVDRSEPLPLSFAQQGMWFLQQMEPASGAYNMPGGMRLKGTLDIEALERSLSEVARRHESLRTSFPMEAGRIVQRIAEPFQVGLRVDDLTRLLEVERENELERVMKDEAARPFDLGHGPLWRGRLLRLGEQEHIFLYTMHHIISDEWSMGVLIKEVATLYRAFALGEKSPLGELPVQYADYSAWQRDWLQGEVLDERINYWRGQLAGAPPVLDLPTDKPRPLVQTTKGAHVNLQLPAGLTQQLKELSRNENATLFMTLLAAFEVLLHKHTGQQDIVVGTPIANRERREVEGLIGAFINGLAIRVNLSGNPTFQELISRVRSVVLGAFAHLDMPFEKLMEVLQPARQPGYAPLFQVVFNYLQAPEPVIELPNLSISFLEVNLERAKYDLTLYIGEGHDGLSGNLTYKTDLFEATTIERMLKDFENILVQMVAQPDAQLSTIRIAADTAGESREQTERQMLGSIRRKTIKLSSTSLVRMSGAFPLVLQPAVEDLDLCSWAQANGDFIDDELLKHGAILFRGFNVSTVEDFRRFAATVTTDLVNYIEGSSERVVLGDQVYTSSEYPAEHFISLHNELSYAHRWPGRLFFFCLQPPESGGETPIADSRKVLDLISPQIKENFLRKGVKYVRNLRAGNGAGLSWQMVFETDDQAFVEGYCRDGTIEFEWQPEGGLRTSQVRPAVARHPRTGEMVWFNQADQWHPSNLGSKLAAGLESSMREEDLPINAYYGDGSPFNVQTLEEVRRAYREATVTFPWQKGDVMLLDNMLVAHGRMPFSGPRRVAVAMGAPVALKEIEMVAGSQS